MIDWKQYPEKPTEATLSLFPSLIDVIKQEVEEEEKKQLYKYPLDRPHTMLYDFDKVGRYFMVQDDLSKLPVMMPMSRTPFTFYRGQLKYFDSCLPVLYRYKGEELERQRLLSKFQISEMILVMQTHPVINDFMTGALNVPLLGKIKLPILYEGLAQHYGINTEYLDLTNNIWSAAFFASAKFLDGKYYPYEIKENAKLDDRYGVIYRLKYGVDEGKVKSFSKDMISPIGLQYFNRPGRQCAFVKKMSENENFNDTQSLEKIYFRHDNDANRLVFTLCQMGKQFYVEDSLANVVDEIRKNNLFCTKTVNLVRDIYYPKSSVEQIIRAAKVVGIELSQGLNTAFDSEQMNQEAIEWFYRGGRDRYIDSIMVLPIRKDTIVTAPN